MSAAARSLVARCTERLLWVLSITALGIWAFASSNAWMYQAYANWSFVRALNGETVSRKDFVLYLLGRSEPLPAPSIRLSPQPAPDALSPLLGRLEIPSIDLSAMFLEGIDAGTLSRGVGHIPNTALPGFAGNIGLAAHRDTFFRRIEELRIGDAVLITTLSANYQYVVDAVRIVDPADIQVLDDVGAPVLTLVTCYPFRYIGPAPKRYIVRARLIQNSPAPISLFRELP